MLVKINCPTCGTEGTTSFVESRYAGPYKCWKCKALFNMVIEDKVVKSCEPLSEEEFQALQEENRKQQEIDALRNKFKK